MESKELRVGNIVEKGGVEYVADFITIEMAHNYNPIPLTPEILEKCGFEMYNNSACYIKKYSNQGELILFSTDTPVGMANNLEPNCFYYGFNHVQHMTKYIHQLQNLYYALTGTDLDIKL